MPAVDLRISDWSSDLCSSVLQHLQVLTFIDIRELIKPEFNFSFLSGTLGATVSFNPRLRLLSNFGISARPPHVSELYSEGLHHGTASIEEGLMRKTGTVYTEQSMINNEYSRKWINTLQSGDNVFTTDRTEEPLVGKEGVT